MDNCPNVWLIGAGFAVGLVFGAIVQRQRFCMVAAVGNLVLMRDWRHVQAFLAAFAVAIAGTQWLEAGALVPVAESAYRVARGEMNLLLFSLPPLISRARSRA
jgi:uncharacterized protein